MARRRARPIATVAFGTVLLAGLGVPALAGTDTATTPPANATGALKSDTTITKAGAALRDIARLQRDYDGRIQSAGSDAEKRGLSDRANAEAMQAIQTHGLSIDEYTQVVRLAQADPDVKRRLLDAADETR